MNLDEPGIRRVGIAGLYVGRIDSPDCLFALSLQSILLLDYCGGGATSLPVALISWKEIAAYLGKGVRTVQRWEEMERLPVRRPSNRPSGPVLAYPQELDEWLHSTFVNRDSESNASVAKLHRQIHELKTELEKVRAENELLHRRLHLARRAALNMGRRP